VAVTGHYRAGETLPEVLREAQEEIGLSVGPDDVTHLGTRKRSHHALGLVDNEIQDVYLTVQARALASLVPGADELDGILGVPLSELTQLVNGHTTRVVTRELRASGQLVSSGLRARDLVPADDGYYARALASVRAAIEDAPLRVWSLGS